MRRCWYCRHELWSLCDNTNPNGHLQELLLGDSTAGIYGYTHAFGGYAGSHAEYVRVPFADNDCIPVPDAVQDDQPVFLSDAVPTGFMGADFCDLRGGETVASWGCGAVGLMAQRSAYLLGAGRVIAIDRFPDRLAAHTTGSSRRCGWEPIGARPCARPSCPAAKPSPVCPRGLRGARQVPDGRNH